MAAYRRHFHLALKALILAALLSFNAISLQGQTNVSPDFAVCVKQRLEHTLDADQAQENWFSDIKRKVERGERPEAILNQGDGANTPVNLAIDHGKIYAYWHHNGRTESKWVDSHDLTPAKSIADDSHTSFRELNEPHVALLKVPVNQVHEEKRISEIFGPLTAMLPVSTRSSIDGLLVHFKTNPIFQSFLKTHNIKLSDLNSADQKCAIIRAYKDYYFESLKDTGKLSKIQGASLKSGLEDHGAGSSTKDGRGTLEQLSRENKIRILGRVIEAIDRTDFDELNALVEQVQLTFIHNTNTLDKLPNEPILSSRRLNDLGLSGGLNTHPFNKDIMKTDDNVFFVVKLRRKDDHSLGGLFSYGDTSLVLNHDYAEQHGWISHFVMNPGNLVQFGEHTEPGKYKAVVERNPWVTGAAFDDAKDTPQIPDQLKQAFLEIKAQLHSSDFTVSDFEEIVKKGLLTGLNRLKQNNPSRYRYVKALIETGKPPHLSKAELESAIQKIRESAVRFKLSPRIVESRIERLSSSSPEEISDILGKMIEETLGVSKMFELKVPVAVPSDQLTVFRKQ